jgi:hypothetical protein
MKKTDLAQVQKDLYEIGREVDEGNLAAALDKDTFDLRTVAYHLRRLAGGPISPDVVNKLADYLDPDIPNPHYKEGPKPKKKRSWMFGYQVVSDYYFLCENLELARFAWNQDNEAFSLIEDSELWDADGNFAPQWKYPLSKSKRERMSFPKRGDIKDLICEMYSIGPHDFDDLRAAYRK